MKKSFLLSAIIFFCISFASAQNELLVQNIEKNLYLPHTVVAKESFYSIGRLYNVPPKDIASFNSLDMTHGLVIGQQIKIPLGKANFSQSADKGRPVFYVVGSGEGLYRVSLKNHNVLMANLRKWNHLTDDKIETGQKLVIGYLVSPEASNIVASSPPEEVKKEEVVKSDEVVEKKPEPEKKEEIKPPVEEKKVDPPPVKTVARQVSVKDGDGGYFRPQFESQIKAQPLKADETATAGIFKTASGWQDSKYYVLMDRVEPGTIIRIVNPTNNKAVYAKVLGEMSGIRQNQGFDVRISNAAASALDINDTDKFILKLNY